VHDVDTLTAMPPTQYVTVQVTPEARESLRRWQLQASALIGRRLSMGDAVRVAIAVAERHTDEVSPAPDAAPTPDA
jgi:hypothetical protein